MLNRSLLTCFLLTLVTHAEAEPIQLDPATRERCLEILRQGLHGEDFWPSIHAAEGLSLGGHGAEVIAFLKPKLPLEKDDQRRCGLARELVRAGEPQQAKLMLKILAGDDSYGHVHAAESLYKVNQIGDGKALRAALKQQENAALQLMAAGALARQGNAQAMQILRDRLLDDDPAVFRVAAWILGRIGDASDVPRIREQLSRCPDELTRAYLEHSLAALSDAVGRKALARNLTSKDPAVRTYAATFAGDAHATELAPQLKKILDDPHPDARIRAAQSLLVLASPKKSDSE